MIEFNFRILPIFSALSFLLTCAGAPASAQPQKSDNESEETFDLFKDEDSTNKKRNKKKRKKKKRKKKIDAGDFELFEDELDLENKKKKKKRKKKRKKKKKIDPDESIKPEPDAESNKGSVPAETSLLPTDYQRYNPVVLAGIITESVSSNALNIMVGAETFPSQSGFGAEAHFHFKHLPTIGWLNWLGLGYQSIQYSPAKVSFVKSGEAEPISATISSKKDVAILKIAPTFSTGIIENLGLEIRPIDQLTEKISFEIPGSGKSDLSYKLDGSSLRLFVNIVPAKNISLGMSIMPPLGRTITATDNSDGTPRSASGTYTRFSVAGHAGFKYFVSPTVFLSAIIELSYFSDKVKADEIVAPGGIEINDTSIAAFLRIGYTPESDPLIPSTTTKTAK